MKLNRYFASVFEKICKILAHTLGVIYFPNFPNKENWESWESFTAKYFTTLYGKGR